MPAIARGPTTNSIGVVGWTNPTDAYAPNGVSATASPVKNATVSSYFGGFGFSSVPVGATIDSVTIQCRSSVSTEASLETLGFYGVVNGSQVGTEYTSTAITTSLANYNAQITPTPSRADLLDGVFQVYVRASRGNSNTAFTMNLDEVAVTVNYTLSQTATPSLASVSPAAVNPGSLVTVSGGPATLTSAANAVAGAVAALGVIVSLSASAPATAGAAANATTQTTRSTTPTLVGASPSPATVGQLVTVTGSTGASSTVSMAAVAAASAAGGGTMVMTQGFAAVAPAAASASANMAPRTPAPVLNYLSPNPVAIGSSLTVTGGGLTVSAVSPAGASASAPLSVAVALAAVAPAAAVASGGLANPIVIPATLGVSSLEATNGSVSGADLLLDAGEWVEYRVDAGSGGDFTILGTPTATQWGRLDVSVDDAPIKSLNYAGDIDEEDGETMPAHSVTEAQFSVSGATAVQADGAGRVAPATRYRVRIVNTAGTNGPRIAVGRSQGAAEAANPEVVEADYGVWEDYLDAAVPVWVRSMDGTAVNVRIIQYATA